MFGNNSKGRKIFKALPSRDTKRNFSLLKNKFHEANDA